jgi:hypothetical protein
MKRGFTYAEAMAYVGVKRRTFDTQWRPRLNPMQQGACVIFDRIELDALFDQFKDQPTAVADLRQPDDFNNCPDQNGPRNERPNMKGVSLWAERQPGSTPVSKELGKSTSTGKALDFASVASSVLKRRKAG